MIVAIKDAKDKICCVDGPVCHGDRCMAWRWLDAEQYPRTAAAQNYAAKTEEEAGAKPITAKSDWQFFSHVGEEGACWAEPIEKARGRRRGFCGLAGIPEQQTI